MPGVYSTRFILGSGAVSLSYAVPLGKRAVIKMISGTNTGTTPLPGTVDIGGIYVWVGSVPGQSALFATGLYIVANAGELIRTGVSAGMHYAVAGFLLDAT